MAFLRNNKPTALRENRVTVTCSSFPPTALSPTPLGSGRGACSFPHCSTMFCSTAGRDKRTVKVDGVVMPRCKRGGDCKAKVGDCGLCTRCMCQCSGTPREELFSKKYNPDGTKKGIGRPVGLQGVKAKAKPSVFAAAPRASSLAAIPKNAGGRFKAPGCCEGPWRRCS